MTAVDCPCTNADCERHGNCDACRENHYGKGGLPACERDAAPKAESRKPGLLARLFGRRDRNAGGAG